MNNRARSLLLATVSFFMLAGCQTQQKSDEDNSWTLDNLNGNVKRFLEVTYRAEKQGDTYVKGQQGQTYMVKSYSTNGFLISELNYYSDSNQPAGGFNYVYDQDYTLIRVESVDNQGGIIGSSEIVELQGKVSIKEYHQYYITPDSSMLTAKTKMSYEGSLLTQALSYGPTDELESTSNYTYDEDKNLISFDVNMIKPRERYWKMMSSYKEFDDKGNWTVQLKEYENMPIKELVERQYEYYD